MSNELTKEMSDGFSGYETGVEDEEQVARGIMKGTRLKFSNLAEWLLNGVKLPSEPKPQMIAEDVFRAVQKWVRKGDGYYPESRILGPGERNSPTSKN